MLADDVLGVADALGRDGSRSSAMTGAACSRGISPRASPRGSQRAAILNAPHPAAMGRFVRRHPGQLARSWYVAFFQLPGLPERMLAAADFAWLGNGLAPHQPPRHVHHQDLARYREAWARPGALTAMLSWYRAVRLRQPLRARVRCRSG